MKSLELVTDPETELACWAACTLVRSDVWLWASLESGGERLRAESSTYVNVSSETPTLSNSVEVYGSMRAVRKSGQSCSPLSVGVTKGYVCCAGINSALVMAPKDGYGGVEDVDVSAVVGRGGRLSLTACCRCRRCC